MGMHNGIQWDTASGELLACTMGFSGTQVVSYWHAYVLGCITLTLTLALILPVSLTLTLTLALTLPLILALALTLPLTLTLALTLPLILTLRTVQAPPVSVVCNGIKCLLDIWYGKCRCMGLLGKWHRRVWFGKCRVWFGKCRMWFGKCRRMRLAIRLRNTF